MSEKGVHQPFGILKSFESSSMVEKNYKWHRRFISLADHVAQWSKDPSTKCGSVIVDNKQRIISLGYNGLARGVKDLPERLLTRELKYELTIHAEENALLFANGKNLEGCTLYVTPLPTCVRCASKVIQSGISTVVAPVLPKHLVERWGDSVELSKEIFKEANVRFIELS